MNLICINQKHKNQRLIEYRQRLLKKYLKELRDLYNISFSNEESNLYNTYIASEHTEWIDIFADDSDEPVGFLVVGEQENCHPDANYYIEELYVEPEFRNKGLASATATNFLHNHKGIYCLFIINDNNIAKIFWDKVFTSCRYTETKLYDEYSDQYTYCKLYGYKPQTT